jgi:hypothetical protein
MDKADDWFYVWWAVNSRGRGTVRRLPPFTFFFFLSFLILSSLGLPFWFWEFDIACARRQSPL